MHLACAQVKHSNTCTLTGKTNWLKKKAQSGNAILDEV
jgi:hypothetical protein